MHEETGFEDSGEAAALRFLLRDLGPYEFITPTPATHRRFLERNPRAARDLRDVFGWSLPFEPGLLPARLLRILQQGGLLASAEGGRLRSKVRVSTLGGLRFVHSAYPTDARDSVFFGPDSYRFARFLRAQLPKASPGRLVDIGAGSGVGGIVAALLPGAAITLLDVNPTALRFAAANAAAAGVPVALIEGKSLNEVSGRIDLAIANPPYIMDDAERAYRHGGDLHGARVSLDWALEAAERLTPGGTMLLYTGVAIVDGRDALREALGKGLPSLGCALTYEEIDPDIFGEELEQQSYRDVERIAAVGAVITKRG
ncbi:MAG: class SAM-dependent methyltransferase [Alphaproteobacteria bacterium]|nr:class SAM-dependent methyltransferase [Alphaproteobacteria bacterium]